MSAQCSLYPVHLASIGKGWAVKPAQRQVLADGRIHVGGDRRDEAVNKERSARSSPEERLSLSRLSEHFTWVKEALKLCGGSLWRIGGMDDISHLVLAEVSSDAPFRSDG